MSGLHRKIAMAVLLLALALSLTILAGRWQAERKNNVVSLAVDWSSMKDAVGSDKERLDTALSAMLAHNLRTIALSEPTVGELLDDGRLFLTTPGSPEQDDGPVGRLYLGTYDKALCSQVTAAMKRKWPGKVSEDDNGDIHYIRLTGKLESIADIGVGILPRESNYLVARGFEVIPRLNNYPQMSAGSLASDIAALKEYKFDIVIFGGEEVMGYEKLLPRTAAELLGKGLRFGQVEFSKQKGEEPLARRMHGNIVRVHSIPADEIKSMSVSAAVDRYVRAVQERNIRLCYLRFLPAQAGVDPLQSNMDFLTALKGRLQRLGFTVGRPATLPKLALDAEGAGLPVSVSSLLLWLLSLGDLAAFMLLQSYLRPDAGVRYAYLLAVLMLPAAMAAPGLFGKLAALAAAVIFPSLAIAFLHGRLRRLSGSGLRRAWPQGLWLLWMASLITLSGALIGAGMMAGRDFMLGVDRFAGIKIAHLLPLMLTAYLLWQDYRSSVSQEGGPAWREVWQRPLLWGETALAGILCLGALVYLMRTGNDGGAVVAGTELKARALLEKLLVARPRTKEFVIGHPAALAAAAAIGLPAWSRLMPFCLLAAAIGQISLFNSFCHIHTPLAFTLLRSFNGLWLGSMVGLAVIGMAAAARTLRKS